MLDNPNPSASPLIGQILLASGKIDLASLERALRIQKEGAKERLGSLLVTLGMAAAKDVAQALASQQGLAFIDSAQFPDSPMLEEKVSARFLKDIRALPISEDAQTLTLAMADPTDAYAIKAFQMVTGRQVQVVAAVPADIEAALDKLYNKKSGATDLDGAIRLDGDDLAADVQQLKDLASEAPVIRLVSQLITKALEVRASDIHIEPFDDRLIIRYRIDGVMHAQDSPPKRLAPAVISRVKILANLDIAERRLPQDGRIRLRAQGKEIDLRVSTVPTMHGESVVMRILDKGGVVLDFDRLGFTGKLAHDFQHCLKQPNGILLVTGPTGSGKTTTLYTALAQLNQPDVKILTVEDPVEYQMQGVNQIQVKPQIDLTFANALRSIVRQDPDIIMIGEIRDLETAQIAVQSALTGHLVLSTLHTNDAPSSINRLLDMGVQDYLLTSTLIGVLAQRLVRTLCDQCREPYSPMPEVVQEMGLMRLWNRPEPITLYKPVGCANCSQTGFLGRVAICEMMPMSESVRSLVMRHANASDLRVAALAQGMQPMYDDGLSKALAGVTTIEEVVRATREG
jgi:general secretion pathway protein E